jgi:pyruvate dehydrogenase E2 component (dihydrolipoamide acetyltransferase)
VTDTVEFVMPSLGPDMDEGRIAQWRVGPGDHVERGQIVVVVETDKSDIEVEVFESATVDRLLVEQGATVDVGVPIATLRPDEPTHRRAPPQRPSAVPDDRRRAVRRRIATTMSRAWSDIPHYHVVRRLGLAAVVARLEEVNRSQSLADRIVPSVLLLCAAARAARTVPECNGWWRADDFEPADRVDLGVVVSLRTGGIVVPVIRDAADLSPLSMMRAVTEAVEGARTGHLRSAHAGEPSITVTNLGERGADAVFGVIHPPQVALVGFGAIRPEVVVDGAGAPAVEQTTTAVMSGDHRATDGLTGSRFLGQVQQSLDEMFGDADLRRPERGG